MNVVLETAAVTASDGVADRCESTNWSGVFQVVGPKRDSGLNIPTPWVEIRFG